MLHVVSILCTCVGSNGELLKELKSLMDVLVHLEPSVIKTVTTNHQVCVHVLGLLMS